MQLHLLTTLVVLGLMATSTRGLLTARLSEVDYLGSEDSPVLNIAVSVDGSHSQPVTLQIIPLTFSMYQTLIDQSPDLICQIPLPNGENEAESSDFNTTIIESVLEPSTSRVEELIPFDLHLASDATLEGEEVFLVLLRVISTEVVTVDRRCALARLQGVNVNQEVVRLDQAVGDLELPEHAGTVLLFNITKIVETELTINIQIVIIDQNGGGDFTILPGTTLEIPPEVPALPVYMNITDDILAEDSESTEIQVKASITRTPVSQQLQTRVTIHDNEVVEIGFAREEVVVTEGSTVRVIAMLINITADNFQRFDDEFPVSTEDGTAIAGVHYFSQTNRFLGFLGAQFFELGTRDNDLINEPRSFTFGFQSGIANDLTVIQQSSVRIVIMDNDAPPPPPSIDLVTPSTANNTLTVTWTAVPTPTEPIDRFVVVITVGDRETQFNVSSTTNTFTLDDYQEEQTHSIAVCAVNVNGINCSTPRRVNPPPIATPPIITPGEPRTTTVNPGTTTVNPGTTTVNPGTTSAPAKISPGLIAGIAAFVAALLCCCLFLLFLCLCLCWKVDRQKSYWPAKSEAKQIRGKRPDSTYSSSYEYDEDSTSESKASL